MSAYVLSGLGGLYSLVMDHIAYLASKGHTSAISLIREQMLGLVCEIVLVQYHTKVSYVLRQLISKVE